MLTCFQIGCSPLRPRTRMPPGRCPPTCQKSDYNPVTIKISLLPAHEHLASTGLIDRLSMLRRMTSILL